MNVVLIKHLHLSDRNGEGVELKYPILITTYVYSREAKFLVPDWGI
jgi:hypothetical protein